MSSWIMVCSRIPATEFLCCLRVGQFAVDQQVGSLDEIGLGRELFNRIAAVAKDSLFAIEVRDRTACATRVHEAFIERDQSG